MGTARHGQYNPTNIRNEYPLSFFVPLLPLLYSTLASVLRSALRKIVWAWALGLGLAELQAQQHNFSLADLSTFHYFTPKPPPVIVPARDPRYFYMVDQLSNGHSAILKKAFASLEVIDTLFSTQWLNDGKAKYRLDKFILSPNEKYVYLVWDIRLENEKIRWYRGQLWEIASRKALPYRASGNEHWIRNPSFSPNSSYFTYVTHTGLFVYHLGNRTIRQITRTHPTPQQEAGIPPSAYLEGFQLLQGYEWSHDDKILFYYEADYSEVPTMPILQWDTPYPSLTMLPYAVPGHSPPVVSIHYYDFERHRSDQIPLLKGDRHGYIPRMFWSSYYYSLMVVYINRTQQKLTLWSYSLIHKRLKPVYTESDSTWIDNYDNWHSTPDGVILFTSDKKGYNHLYALRPPNFQEIQLTHEDVDVDRILAYNPMKSEAYFLGFPSNLPIERHLYKTVVKPSVFHSTTQLSDYGHSIHNALFASNFTYYISTYSSINTPPITRVFRSQFPLHIIEDNHILRQRLKQTDLPYYTSFSFVTPAGDKLYGHWLAPPQLSYNRKYPVVFDVYNGPNSKHVINEWQTHWFFNVYLALQGFIVVQVDGRGTKGRGRQFKKSIYGELGKNELSDIIYTATHLTTRFSFLDSSNIAIMGHSYGGYLALMALMRYPYIFKAGIAVSPVTDWRLYHNIYSERYMNLPSANPQGYQRSSVLSYVPSYQQGLLLIHGTYDANVPIINTYKLVEKLTYHRKDYRLRIYPDGEHSLLRYQSDLYQEMFKFLQQRLIVSHPNVEQE